MNGQALDPSHGFPVRLLVPGSYGVASVKWLNRIEAVTTPFEGLFQSVKYTNRRSTGRGVPTESVGPMPVKSEIIRPADDAVLGVGANRVFGMAWAGESAVAAVEISVDHGETWHRAELNGPRAPYSWTLWEYLWRVDVPGKYAILARDFRIRPHSTDRARQ
jgi:DMSO/TMAO reductase YedYZ molybdopterin-dependent catalytic subunit